MAEAIAALLDEAAVTLEQLAGQVVKLQPSIDAIRGDDQEDGSTLDAEVVLEWRIPGMANDSRFHVRVFRPSGKLPVVVIGDMSDNCSQSITNTVSEVAAIVTEYMLGGGPPDSYLWVQVDPPGRFRTADADFGVIQVVSFEDRYGRPRWQRLTHEHLEELAGGAVRRWHSSDYNVVVMINRGIPILHPGTERHQSHGENA